MNNGITVSAPAADLAYIALDFDGVLHHREMSPRRGQKWGGMTASQIRCVLNTQFLHSSVTSLYEERANPRTDVRCLKDSCEWEEGEDRLSRVLFDREHHLHRILNAFPSVRLVISTSWRWLFTEPVLRQLLSRQTAARIVGMLDLDRADGQGSRGQKMTEWLRRRSLDGAAWIGLDDDRGYYRKFEERLVQTTPGGLDNHSAQAAIARLRDLFPGGYAANSASSWRANQIAIASVTAVRSVQSCAGEVQNESVKPPADE